MNYGVSTRWQRRFPSLLARRRRGSIWAKLTSLSSTTAGTPRFSTGAPYGPNGSIKTRSRRRWPPCSPGCRKGPAAGASLSGANGDSYGKSITRFATSCINRQPPWSPPSTRAGCRRWSSAMCGICGSEWITGLRPTSEFIRWPQGRFAG